MSEPLDESQVSSAKPDKTRQPIRAAALGLLAIVAIISIALLFGGGESSVSGAPESASESSVSAAPTSAASASVSASPQSTPGASTTAEPTPTASASATDNVADQSEPTSSGASVLITSHAWNQSTLSIEVVGSVQGVATETSTCTATATQDVHTATASGAGLFDGQGTSCGLLAIPMSGMPSGEYQVVVTFTAAAGSMSSQAVVVTVP